MTKKAKANPTLVPSVDSMEVMGRLVAKEFPKDLQLNHWLIGADSVLVAVGMVANWVNGTQSKDVFYTMSLPQIRALTNHWVEVRDFDEVMRWCQKNKRNSLTRSC